MSREVRKVPKDWEHPVYDCNSFKPLLEGYMSDALTFMELAKNEGLQEAIEIMSCPDKNDYMPDWVDSDKTHFMMYETTSEGKPVSPAFETAEELAQWLVDNNISAFATQTASYEGWLRIARGGFAPSMVLDNNGILVSGVDGLSPKAQEQE